MDDRQQENAEIFINWLTSITEFTQQIVFPPFLQGAVKPPDMKNWPKLRKFLYQISSPFSIRYSTQSTLKYYLQIIIFFIWAITLFLWSSTTITAFEDIFGISETNSASPSISPHWDNLLTIFYVISLFLIPLAYYRLVEFMLNSRYHLGWRIFFLILLVGFIVIFPICILEPEYRIMLSGNAQIKFLFYIVYCLFWIPYLSQVYIIVIEIIVLIGRAFVILITYLSSTHDPFPKSSLIKLLLESTFENPKTKEKRLFLEFSKYELETLHKWSKANQESTNKRLLPTTLFFAFLALFSTQTMFENAKTQFRIWLLNFFDPLYRPSVEFIPFVSKSILIFIIFFFIGIFFISLIRLFGNLVTQSVIIEACIVAEYVQSKDQNCDNVDSKIHKKSIWQRLFKL